MRRLLGLLGLLLVAATWFTWLRPATLGGDVSYVMVDGSSMEPTYEDGDLVLARQENRYDEGDIITFRVGGRFDDPARVIHRIIGTTGDGAFVTQGDNRDHIDPWHPTPDDIIGRAWLHIPFMGKAAGVVARPETLAALAGSAALVGGTRRRRRRRAMPTPDPRPAMTRVQRVTPSPEPATVRGPIPRTFGFTEPRWAFIGLVASALVLVPTLALTWSALRAPDSIERTQTTGSVDHAIGIDYRFTGAPSAVYPDGEVAGFRDADGAIEPDGPLYIRLLDTFEATIGFRATAIGTNRLTASATIDVDVETPGGWDETLDSIALDDIDRTASETVTLDLREIASKVREVADLTGVGGDSYTLTITPRLTVAASNDSDSVDEELDAPLTVSVDGNLATVEASEAAQTRTLTETVRVRADFDVGPFALRTQMARAVLSGLALVLVAGVAWFASVLFGGVGLGEPDRIAARYRTQIVDVATAAAPPGPVVMVGGIDELSRIAKLEQTVILHEETGDGAHRYRVFLGSVTYEYEAAPEHAGAAIDEVAEDAAEDGGG